MSTEERDAWLSEMWAPCREVPRDVRAGWAAIAGVRNELLGEQCETPVTPVTKAA